MCRWARLTSTGFECISILWAEFGYSSQSWALVRWADVDYLGLSPLTPIIDFFKRKYYVYIILRDSICYLLDVFVILDFRNMHFSIISLTSGISRFIYIFVALSMTKRSYQHKLHRTLSINKIVLN